MHLASVKACSHCSVHCHSLSCSSSWCCELWMHWAGRGCNNELMSLKNERSCNTFSGLGTLATGSIFSCNLRRPSLSISCPQNWTLSLEKSHFSLFALRPASCSWSRSFTKFSKCSSSVLWAMIMLSKIHWVSGTPCKTWPWHIARSLGKRWRQKTVNCIGKGLCAY